MNVTAAEKEDLLILTHVVTNRPCSRATVAILTQRSIDVVLTYELTGLRNRKIGMWSVKRGDETRLAFGVDHKFAMHLIPSTELQQCKRYFGLLI